MSENIDDKTKKWNSITSIIRNVLVIILMLWQFMQWSLPYLKKWWCMYITLIQIFA